MKGRRLTHSRRGFTVVEAIIAVAIVGLVILIGVPTLQRLLHRTKIENAARETAILMRAARFEAIKRGVPAVVRIEPATREVIGFADVHGGLDPTLPSDGVFAAIPGAVNRTTDYEIGRIRLPSGVSFSFQAQTDLDSVDGFVNPGTAPDPPDDQAIFQTDGSVLSAGAFRFGDVRGNFLEARVDPPATARVVVRKWDDTDSDWYEFGQSGKPWQWN